MDLVTVMLDESVVVVCKTHSSCDRNNKKTPQDDCDRRWIYGVGAAVYETSADLQNLRERLRRVRESILNRTGLDDAPHMPYFEQRGWHATSDGPEFTEPLLSELDRGATFKGHVRYCVSTSGLLNDEKEQVFDLLFTELIRVLVPRYRRSDRIDFIFEADDSKRSRYVKICNRAGVHHSSTVRDEPKGDVTLAMADYLLYATMKYVARVIEVCKDESCTISHLPPLANDVTYSEDGKTEVSGHLNGSTYAHRFYKTFARTMSSARVTEKALGNLGKIL